MRSPPLNPKRPMHLLITTASFMRALWSYRMQSYLVQKFSDYSFADSSIWKRIIIKPSSRLRRSSRFLTMTIAICDRHN